MRRREFIAGLGSAAAWPAVVQGQQAGTPVIGLLTSRGPTDAPQLIAAVRQGLKETGFVEGQNVAIEYRFAENHNERLPALAADLVQRQVSLIAATTTPAALAAKAATRTIPIVFEIGFDPVALGLVAALNRPGGNVTGVTNSGVEVAPKRLELLHELIPSARLFALLVDPSDPSNAEAEWNSGVSAAHKLLVNLHRLNASSERDFEDVFASFAQLRAGGLDIAAHAFFTARSEQLATLTLRHAVPAVYENREFVAAGGLVSYGGALSDAYRQVGVYAARILRGEKPSELPVQQVVEWPALGH